MRPTFMGLETAKRGLMVNQKAIDIVGNNITNMQTKGLYQAAAGYGERAGIRRNGRFSDKLHSAGGPGR